MQNEVDELRFIKYFIQMKNYVVSILFFLFSLTGLSAIAQNSEDLFELDLKTKGEAGAWLIKTQEYLGSQLDSAYVYANKALKLAAKKKDSALLAHSYYLLSNYAYFAGNLPESEKFIDSCLVIANSKDYTRFRFEGYRLKGAVASNIHGSNQALENFLKALKIAKGNPALEILIRDDIAVLHIKNKDYNLARAMMKEALDAIKGDENNPAYFNSLSHIYSNLSVISSDYEEALDYSNKSIAVIKNMQNKEKELDARFSKAKLLFKFKKYPAAISLLNEILTQAKAANFMDKTYSMSILLAQSYLKVQDYASARNVVNPLVQTFEPYRDKYPLNKMDSIAIAVYSKLNDGERTAYHLNHYLSFLKNVVENARSEGYLEYSKKYETDLKIKENELLKKENRIQHLNISKEKMLRYAISVIAILVLIAAIALYYRYRDKKKMADIFSEKNQIITEQKINLEEANETKQKLFSIIAHDLINPFNTMLGYTKLLHEDFESFTTEEKRIYLATIYKYASQNYELTKNLLDWARIHQNKIILNRKDIVIKELVETSVAPYRLLAEKKKIETSVDIDKKLTFSLDKDVLTTIVSNLYSNAIKYTPNNGKIKIASYNLNSDLVLFVEDTGIGMDKGQIDSIFQTVNTSIPGTNNEKGTGLGLIICKELVELHGGTIRINSDRSSGTTVTINIPSN